MTGNAGEGWQARLTLGFERRYERTTLVERKQLGPLSVQRPFYPEGDLCHAYILHPPGGIVGGDSLTIEAKLTRQASALLTTPGASKFYRSSGQPAVLNQQFRIDDGCLEWLPHETIFFPGAQARLNTQIRLGKKAHFVGWEIHCLGRPAIQERFDDGSIDFQTQLFRENKPLFIDRFTLDDQHLLDSPAALLGQPVMATLIATLDQSHDTRAVLQSVRPLCEIGYLSGQNSAFSGHAAATVFNELLLVRYLGPTTAEAQRLFRAIWQYLRPQLLKREAVAPRIWAT